MNALARLVAAAGATAVGRDRLPHRLVRDRRIAAHERTPNPAVKRNWLHAAGDRPRHRLGGSGNVVDFKQFSNGAQFGAWFGLVPRQSTQRRQEQPRGHHQTRRHLPAHAAHPGRQVGGDGAGAATRSGGRQRCATGRLAEGGRGAGQQERPHPVGRHDPGEAFDARHVSVKPGVQAVAAPAD